MTLFTVPERKLVMVRTLWPVSLGLMFVLAAPAVRADAPPDGNYQLSFVLGGSIEANWWLIKLETKDGKLAGSVTDIAQNAQGSTLKTVTSDGKQVRVTFNTPRGDLVFEGQLPLAKKTVRGSMDFFGQLCPATMAATNETKLEPNTAIRQLSVPPLDQASKLDKHLDSLALFAAVTNMVKGAKKNKLSADEVRGAVEKADKTASTYGRRWHTEFDAQIADALAGQKDYAAIALEISTRLDKQLGPKAAAEMQSRVLKILATAQGNAGKGAAAKETLARLAKVEEILDREYFSKVPPFKGEQFVGRKAKSDRTVVLELFTGAQCPPCVAADVAFDVLQKTYKPAELVLIQYHMHIPGPDPLTNADNEERAAYYSIRGTPAALFNGKPQAQGGGFMAHAQGKYDDYRKVIDPLLETEAGAKIAARASRQGHKIDIQVEVSLPKPGDETHLRLVLVEESIRYVGGNKLRFHHQVVRALPGGAKGFALKDKSSKHTASVDLDELRRSLTSYLDNFAKQRPFPSSDRPLDFKNLRLIALVQDDSTKEILQAKQVEIAGNGKAGEAAAE
jgi:hypothetical protein